ncbi:MAG: SpoIIE family protein phosphatase [Bacteroidetes bacterium]|nr:SpoIIE family protein phosphatase [Bacteroidota bacterium]
MLFKTSLKEEIKVPATMAHLADLRNFVVQVAKKHGFDDKTMGALKLATDEAVTNIIRHAYRDTPGRGFVTMRTVIKTNSLTVILLDQGRTFDPRNAKAPDMKEYIKIGKKGGLGIFMLQKLMDEIDYQVTSEGNELRLTKYRDVKAKRGGFLRQINLRNRYAIISSAALTFFVLGGYVTFEKVQTENLQNEILKRVAAISATMASSSAEYMADQNDLSIFQIADALKKDNQDFIIDIYIVDNANRIFASSDRSTLGKYSVPTDYEIVPFLDSKEQPDSVASSLKNPEILDNVRTYRYLYDEQVVYDVHTPVYRSNIITPENVMAYAHVLISEETILGEMTTLRFVGIVLAILILLLGYGGIAILVARIISPFQRLTDWIRNAGHETITDDVDIDTTNEVGEIAQAFSDMASKFRKAQIGLVQQKQLQKEIQVAQEIQHMLLPVSFPEVQGFDIATYYESAKEVGGDLFDFIQVDDDTIGIVVADVSGKGVPGSLVMTMIRTALRLEARGNKNPGEVLAKVNDFVVDDMKKGMFVTMFYIILDSRNRVIHYASAGHNPMILHRASSRQTYYLNPRGFPVGISLPDKKLFGQSIQTDSIKLREDDVLVLYTDGITEAMNPSRDLFSEERFLEVIRRHSDKDAKGFVENVRSDLLEFTQGAPQNDDITFVAVRENMAVGDILFNLRKQMIEDVNGGMSVKEACAKARISSSTYYKYKKRYEMLGDAGLRNPEDATDIASKHLSIEQKAKIFDVIRQNPEFGPKMISNTLNTDKYSNTAMNEKRIYDELVRMRLNTEEKRRAFVSQRTRGRKFKLPGTPLLTMDGQVIKADASSTDSIVDRIIQNQQGGGGTPQPTKETVTTE